MRYSAEPFDHFGYLPQLSTFDDLACTPTSITNALAYLFSKPTFAGSFSELATYSDWENTRDVLASDYLFTSESNVPAGTKPAQAIIGVDQYFTDKGIDGVSISALGISTDQEGRNIAGWNTPAMNGHPAIGPASEYDRLFSEGHVTGEFIRASLMRSDAIIGGGFYKMEPEEPPTGHAVVITALNWTDKNTNGLIDPSDGATMSIIDPLDPAIHYSPVIGAAIGYGPGTTIQEQLSSALNDQITGLVAPKPKTGPVFQDANGLLVFRYDQQSLVNDNGVLRLSTGDSSNARHEPTDMTFMLTMSLGTNGLPDSVDTQISKDMPQGVLLFDPDVFGGHIVEGTIYTTEHSACRNQLQFYQIDSTDGAITDPNTGTRLLPGDAGYSETALALANTSDVMNLGDRQSIDAERLHDFAVAAVQDVMVAPVVTTSAGDAWFAFEQANSDGMQHVKQLALNTYGFEDLRYGGDRDFNDLIFQVIPTQLADAPTPAPLLLLS